MFLCARLYVCILDSTIIHCVCESLRGSLPYMRQSEKKRGAIKVNVGEERESRSDCGACRPPSRKCSRSERTGLACHLHPQSGYMTISGTQ